jgi:hypothetical protein
LIYLIPPGHSCFTPLFPSIDCSINDNGILAKSQRCPVTLRAMVPNKKKI